MRRCITAAVIVLTPVACESGSPDPRSAERTPSEAETPSEASPFGFTEREWSGSGPRVVVVGDSITVGARDQLHERLDDSYRVKIAARAGEGFAGGPFSDELTMEEPLLLDIARGYAADEPDVAVVALGTNDARNPDLHLDDALAGMRSMIDLFDGSCVVGVTVGQRSPGEPYDAAAAEALNVSLRSSVDEVVDAAPIFDVAGNVEDDGIHLTSAGSAAFAEAVALGVERCSPS